MGSLKKTKKRAGNRVLLCSFSLKGGNMEKIQTKMGYAELKKVLVDVHIKILKIKEKTKGE